jgi:hypothetical protein
MAQCPCSLSKPAGSGSRLLVIQPVTRTAVARRYGAVLGGPDQTAAIRPAQAPDVSLSFQISLTLIKHRFRLQKVPHEAGEQVLRAGGALFRLDQGTPLTTTPIPRVGPDLSSRFRAVWLTTRLLVLRARRLHSKSARWPETVAPLMVSCVESPAR